MNSPSDELVITLHYINSGITVVIPSGFKILDIVRQISSEYHNLSLTD